jgi:hypothetical protein
MPKEFVLIATERTQSSGGGQTPPRVSVCLISLKTLARKAAYGLFWGWLIISISSNPGGPGRNEDCSDRGRFIPGCDPPVRRRT